MRRFHLIEGSIFSGADDQPRRKCTTANFKLYLKKLLLVLT